MLLRFKTVVLLLFYYGDVRFLLNTMSDVTQIDYMLLHAMNAENTLHWYKNLYSSSQWISVLLTEKGNGAMTTESSIKTCAYPLANKTLKLVLTLTLPLNSTQ